MEHQNKEEIMFFELREHTEIKRCFRGLIRKSETIAHHSHVRPKDEIQ